MTVRLFQRWAAISALWATLAGHAGQVRAQEKDTVFHGPTLVGKVLEAGGVGIPLVRVSAKASGQTALSDSTGRFMLRGLDTGNVAFTVRRIGFEPSEFTVSLDSGETFTLDLTLNQSGQRSFAVVLNINQPCPRWKF